MTEAVAYLVRHGRTSLNAGGVLRGRLNPPLDEVGQAQAEALGEAFAGVEVVAVVCSPLLRARETAHAISTRHGLSVEVDDGLMDRDYGQWSGVSVAEVNERFGAVDAAPGVEPLADVAARAVATVVSWAERTAPSGAVIVAHDAVNRAVITHLSPDVGPGDSVPQRNGCWNRLERHGQHWSAPVIDALPGQGPSPGQP